jgi:hypothetical protein
MNKPQVCMFCRYRKSRARDLEACCAGADVLSSQTEAGDRPQQGKAQGMPERLRHPAQKQYQPAR